MVNGKQENCVQKCLICQRQLEIGGLEPAFEPCEAEARGPARSDSRYFRVTVHRARAQALKTLWPGGASTKEESLVSLGMKIISRDFRVSPGKKVDLRKWPTVAKPVYKSKEQYQELLERHVRELCSLQRLHYASGRYALLLVLQGMDGAGKDGAIRHVMSGINPQSCEVFSFKQPSAEELHHDFLWRTICRLPERGRIGIFNRSYYEEVLVVRVHPELLRAQGLPEELRKEKTVWEGRYRSIVNMEGHLHRNGTRIVKIFLHLSKEEQRKRFLARIDEPDKNWKFSLADIHERKYWDQYVRAYDACLEATSTHHAPWFVVPADDKENAHLIVSAILLDALRELKLKTPRTTAKRRMELQSIRRQLVK